MLAAFRRVTAADARQAAQLVIVGPPSWGASSVLAEVQAEARDGRVVFTGFVSNARLSHLYQDARCLVFPSLYEGFGLPALEAMAHGTPVITSVVSSLPEVVGDAGLLVEPTDTDAIGAALTRLLQDEPLRRTLSAKSRLRAAQFSWEATAKKTVALYRALLSQSRSHPFEGDAV